eukprot:753282-Hanusia_phi.AAC.1
MEWEGDEGRRKKKRKEGEEREGEGAEGAKGRRGDNGRKGRCSADLNTCGRREGWGISRGARTASSGPRCELFPPPTRSQLHLPEQGVSDGMRV